jgi:hypothetical protein
MVGRQVIHQTAVQMVVRPTDVWEDAVGRGGTKVRCFVAGVGNKDRKVVVGGAVLLGLAGEAVEYTVTLDVLRIRIPALVLVGVVLVPLVVVEMAVQYNSVYYLRGCRKIPLLVHAVCLLPQRPLVPLPFVDQMPWIEDVRR